MGAVAATLEPEKVRSQLSQMLESTDFDASERNRQFLRYSVEETLQGRAHQIKAYAIATLVFGRGQDFDPQLDAIVRIEAGRLRRSLERYYFKAGQRDLIRISMPRGSYAAAFETPGARESQPPLASGEQTSRLFDGRGPSLLVAPFEEEGDFSAFPNFTRGLTRHIVVALTRFSDLRVFGPQTSFQSDSLRVGPESNTSLKVDFLLAGGAMISDGRFHVDALLLDARSGRNLWAGAYDRDFHTADIAAVRDELANSVARTLGQPYGVIFSNVVKDASAALPEQLTSYDLVNKCFEYEQSLAVELFEPAREGLERVIASEPRYAAAFASLSRLYTSAHRYDYDVSHATADPVRRALELARCALRLEPESSAAHRALGMALWFSGDIDGALEALEISGALNPNDTEVMAERGFRYAILADWDKAMPLLRESFALNPGRPSTDRMGFALFHYAHGDYIQALAEARKIQPPNLFKVQLIVAAAAGQAGLDAVAKSAVRTILSIDPDHSDRAAFHLQSLGLEPGLIRHIVEGLRLAGLPVTAPPNGLAGHPVDRPEAANE